MCLVDVETNKIQLFFFFCISNSSYENTRNVMVNRKQYNRKLFRSLYFVIQRNYNSMDGKKTYQLFAAVGRFHVPTND